MTKAERTVALFHVLARIGWAAYHAQREAQIDRVAERARNVERAAATERVRAGGLCCDQGAENHCVCRRSIACPTHGTICIGSHD